MGNKLVYVIVIKLFFDVYWKICFVFSVYLSFDMIGESSLGLKKVIVYIEKLFINLIVMFLLLFRIVLLCDYDDVSGVGFEVIMGYLLICVMVSF